MSRQQTIAILGGGIMGLMSAYACAQKRFAVTIYDQAGFPADNASWIAGGMLAPYSEIEHMDMRWVRAGLASISRWHDFPLETGFQQNGSLLIAHAEDRYILERFKDHLPTELQEYKRPQNIESALPERFKQGLYLEDEAQILPETVMRSLCDYLKDKVTFIQDGKEPDDVQTDWVLDCRGMGAQYKDKDLRGVKGEIALVRNPEFSLERPVRIMHPRYPLYIVPRPNHVFMIGATVIESETNAHVSLRSSMELMSALYSLHSSFGEAQIITFKAGIRPSYPDNLPRIKHSGHIVSANGLFRHGYLLAPIMAEITAAVINDEDHEFKDLFYEQTNDKAGNQRVA
ncbi:MAG: FAD-dependent oxidoreductase [Alphaproteobacteria bacterium]